MNNTFPISLVYNRGSMMRSVLALCFTIKLFCLGAKILSGRDYNS